MWSGKMSEDSLTWIDQKPYDGEPTLPFLVYGEIWYRGWDIEGYYAVDSDKQCWLDSNAYGGPALKVNPERLLKHLQLEERHSDLTKVEEALGLEYSYSTCPTCGVVARKKIYQ
jgi:hypothetical protein